MPLHEKLFSGEKFAILGNMAMSDERGHCQQPLRDLHRGYEAGTQRRIPALDDRPWSSKPEWHRLCPPVYTGGRNRPVLIHENGTCIAIKESQGDLGALSVVISSSRLRLNETSLEDALQTRMRMQPGRLGVERLRRSPAMGAKLASKATEERRDPNFLAKAFMTCLPVTESLALTNARASRSGWSSTTSARR
jgi:hypothetical protein